MKKHAHKMQRKVAPKLISLYLKCVVADFVCLKEPWRQYTLEREFCRSSFILSVFLDVKSSAIDLSRIA